MPANIIIGTQWGDEGKGKVTDYYAKNADVIVRYQGGSNAGHTIVVEGQVHKFHLLPSGIIQRTKTNIISNGVVLDPETFFSEIKTLEDKGFVVDNLFVSERTHIVFPYHKMLDGAEEAQKGGKKIGTTKRGIGPVYTDKIARSGVRVIDLIDEGALRAKLEYLVPQKQKMLSMFGDSSKLSFDEIFNKYADYGRRMKKYVRDTSVMINDALDQKKFILFEGAQGTHLDVDHGTYPYTTSSNTVAGGACTGSGVGPTRITNVIGVVKAYTTRVGEGPMPTELKDETGKHIQDVGGEFGTTTGRPRRCGWLDLVLVRYSCRVNGLTQLAITKIDVLDGIKELKVCKAYKCGSGGETLGDFPASEKVLAQCEPIYDTLAGWKQYTEQERRDIVKKGSAAIPKEMKNYIKHIEKELKVPVKLVSIGAGRESTIEV